MRLHISHRPLDVAIFGAGVAGLATAVALQAIGHRCQVHEQHAAHLDAGMAFLLMPEALDSLRALGVRPMAGQAIRRYVHHDQAGNTVFEVLLPGGVRCMRRRQLLQALRAKLPACSLLAGQGGLSHFEFEGERVRQAWLNAPPDAAPGLLRPIVADLYIAADGTRSGTRRALFPEHTGAPARVFEIVGLLEDGACAGWAGQDFHKFHALHGGTAFGLLPIGADSLVWYLQFDAQALPSRGLRTPRELMEFAQARLHGWAQPVERAMARADFSQAHLWRPLDLDPPPAFHRANLVLAGDAAHPLLPFSSQGVSAAILDAVALGEVLRVGGPTADALTRYSLQRRRERLPHVAQGRKLTDRFFEAVGGGMVPLAYRNDASPPIRPSATPAIP